jgi:hypothetical protein
MERGYVVDPVPVYMIHLHIVVKVLSTPASQYGRMMLPAWPPGGDASDDQGGPAQVCHVVQANPPQTGPRPALRCGRDCRT